MGKLQKFIMNYRLKENVTQEKLAKKMGITKSYISKIEKGEREPSNFKFANKLKKLGLKINQIEKLLK